MLGKKFVLWLICAVMLLSVQAQDTRDSVLRLLLHAPADSTFLHKIGQWLPGEQPGPPPGNPVTLQDLAAIKQKIAPLEESRIKARIYNQLGNIYFNQAAYSMALRMHLSAIQIFSSGNDALAQALSYNLAARDCYMLDEQYRAIVYYFLGVRFAEQIDDTLNRQLAIRGIGKVFLKTHGPDVALPYFKKALVWSRLRKDIPAQAAILNDVGDVYLRKHKPDTAFACFEEAVQLSKATADTYGIACNYENIGNALLLNGQYANALEYLQQAISGAEASNDLYFRCRLYIRLAEAGIGIRKNNEAEAYLNQAHTLANKLGASYLLHQVYENEAILYAQKGQYREAYTFQDSARIYKERLFNEKNITLVAGLELLYQYDRTKSYLSALAKENQQQKKYLQSMALLLVASFLMLVLLVVVGILYIRQQKLKENLRVSQIEQKLLRSQMNPHFIFNALNGIQSYVLKKDTSNATKYLGKFAKLMRNILDNSADAHTTLDNELKLLENYIVLEALRFNDKFSFAFEIGEEIDPRTCTVPAMILQPFIENAIWHGLIPRKEPGGFVKASFHARGGFLVCTIEDNGIGRKQSTANQTANEEINRHKPKGLLITKERLEWYNEKNSQSTSYTITDLYNPDGTPAGTKVEIYLPLEPQG